MRRPAQDRSGVGEERIADGYHLPPPNTGQALDMLARAFQTGTVPPELTLTAPVSVPALDALATTHAEKVRLLSV